MHYGWTLGRPSPPMHSCLGWLCGTSLVPRCPAPYGIAVSSPGTTGRPYCPPPPRAPPFLLSFPPSPVIIKVAFLKPHPNQYQWLHSDYKRPVCFPAVKLSVDLFCIPLVLSVTPTPESVQGSLLSWSSKPSFHRENNQFSRPEAVSAS